MAGIVFKCPNCNNSVASDDNLCGEIAQCPECEKEIIIPIPGVKEGNIYGDFKLLERLGTGASGEVWLAHQQSMDRKVALKILCPKLSSDPNFIERFMKEAKNSAKLAHPNIVTAFFAGQDKGMYYLAISYINGETIETKLERDHLYDEKEALLIIKAIATALQYSWDEFKILHRDIKPANIIVNKKGVPMLLDLGISKSIHDEDASLTMTGTVVGTPYYMSPEQAIADKDLDFRSDLYSLGVTLYHMLSGTVPFQATTAMAIIMKHLNDKFESPLNLNSKLSVSCCELLEIMMAKKKEDRQQSWEALQNDIDAVLAGKSPLSSVPKEGASTLSKSTKAIAIVNDAKNKITSLKNKKIITSIISLIIIVVLITLFSISNEKKEASPSVDTSIKISAPSKTSITSTPPTTSTNPTISTSSTNEEVKDMWDANNNPIVEKADPPANKIKAEPPPAKIPEKVVVTEKPVEKITPKPIIKPVVKITPNPIIKPVVKITPKPVIKNETEEITPTINDNFIEISDTLDYSKNTSIAVKANWTKIDDKEFTWSGVVVNVKGGWFKSEVTIACPGRQLYKGFNLILVTKEKEKAVKLKKGAMITFTGNVYKYKPKRNGLVILYMYNVKFVD